MLDECLMDKKSFIEFVFAHQISNDQPDNKLHCVLRIKKKFNYTI